MEEHVITFFEKGKPFETYQTLNDMTSSEIIQALKQMTMSQDLERLRAFIGAIMYGSPPSDPKGRTRRQDFYNSGVHFLLDESIPETVAKEYTATMIVEADSLSEVGLANCIILIITHLSECGNMSNPRVMDVFPHILTAASSRQSIRTPEGVFSGPQFKGHIMNKFCAIRWPQSYRVAIAGAMKDMTLTTEESSQVYKKLIESLEIIISEELPSMVYQLLLLAKKGPQKLLLDGLLDFLLALDDKLTKQEECGGRDLFGLDSPVEEYRVLQGTILLHFAFVAKQDQAFGLEVIRYIKKTSLSGVLPSFSIALALAVARSPRFEEQMMEFIKSEVLRYYKDREQQAECGWLTNLLQDPETNLTKNFTQLVSNCRFAWEVIIDGVVTTAFNLMKWFGPKSVANKNLLLSSQFDPSALTPAQSACKLGSDTLQTLYKKIEGIRFRILDELLLSIASKRGGPVVHFIELLGYLTILAPQIPAQSQTKLRETVEFVFHIDTQTAAEMLKALRPVLTVSSSLRDHCIMVLRKAIFSNSVDQRVAAAKGIVVLLQNFRVFGSLSASQATQCTRPISSQVIEVDVHLQGSRRKATNEVLCYELIGSLRRSLTQQAEVRATLYEGLVDVIEKNKYLAKPILDVLVKQMLPVYEENEVLLPPIRLQSCLFIQDNQTVIVEPANLLFGCMIQIMFLMVQNQQGAKAGDVLVCTQDDMQAADRYVEEMAESVTRRLIKCDLSDFELDKASDFNLAGTVGQKNTLVVMLAVSLYEVMMEYSFTVGDFEVSSCREVLQLFKKCLLYSDLLAERVGHVTTARPSAKQTERRTMFSMRFLALMIKALFGDNVPSHQESLEVLRSNTDFIKFILTCLHSRLAEIIDHGTCEGPEGRNPEMLFKYISRLARSLMKQIHENLGGLCDGEAKDTKGEQMASCVSALCQVVRIIFVRYKPRFKEFLSAVDGNPEDNIIKKNEMFIKKLQRICQAILDMHGRSKVAKEMIFNIFTSTGDLVHMLQRELKVFMDMKAWFKQICIDNEIRDQQIARHFLSLAIQTSSLTESVASLLKCYARDIRYVLGDLHKEGCDPEKTSNSIISLHTACPTTVALVIHWVDKAMDTIAWLIQFCTSRETKLSVNEDVADYSQLTLEDPHEAASSQMIEYMKVLIELLQCGITNASCHEALLKVISKLYKNLNDLVKLCQLRCEKIGKKTLDQNFEKMVTISGNVLSARVYAMITYMQDSQKESIAQAHERLQKKKTKAAPKKRDGTTTVGKSRVMKEHKIIPSLIFAIEQYEAAMIHLCKKFKLTLVSNFRLSTCRDFRIQTDLLNEVLDPTQEDENDDAEEEMEEGDEGEDEENNLENDAAEASTSQATAQRGAAAEAKQPAKKRARKYKKISDAY